MSDLTPDDLVARLREFASGIAENYAGGGHWTQRAALVREAASAIEEQAAALERLRRGIETTIGNLDQPEPIIDWIVMELWALLDEPGEQ